MEKQSIKNTSSLSSMSSSWVRGTCVGRGCFGAVSTAISKTDGEVFAVKSVDLATCLPAQLESLENEITVLRSLKPHPHIVRFLGDGVSKEGTTSFRNLHLEYLPDGDVAKNGIDEALLRRYTACLVSALRHVHSEGYVHCDVKARNVLIISRSSGVKLADFGSAIGVSKQRATAQITPRGSPLWMAPEVIRGEYQGPESDVWSLGCTVIEMLTGKPAWEDLGVDSLSRIGFSDELPVLPVKLSDTGRDFLDKCLKRDMSQRWSCDQLLQHPFLSESHDSSHAESSPRYVLDWVNSDEEEEEVERSELTSKLKFAAMARICKIETSRGANWESDGWVDVRSHHPSEEEGATIEYSEHNTSLNPYDDVADESAMIDVNVYPNRPPGNLDSAAEEQYEVVMILLLLMECMVYSRTICVSTEYSHYLLSSIS
ncbi:LOW QUALITY PROTEIN: mitogen-activated protein kinase kinase kinase 20 [Raphanus sativus]|uniref:LOW QUALITY PROTEIN: mitogen-activated protein kinase kinase kinase 20 n=1 Tax=Raphanus sativus TaxID=3726 RepID=A0A9W3DD18_RAPSA|nr:LOW QUALITY PROTEIN: mitogen-activated protein kinase kinase kinase 20 [Raphanus sativus]